MTGKKGRRKRLSADLPQHWLHDPVYWSLSDRAWRLHTHAHMWAIGRTDGFISEDMLTMLLPGTDAERELALKELLGSGLWARKTGGWQIPRWRDTQSTVKEIENNRRREREKKQRQRANVPPGTPRRDSPREVPPGSTERHGTARSTRTGSTTSRSVTNPGTNGEGFSCSECERPVSALQHAGSLRRLGRTLCSRCASDAFVPMLMTGSPL